MIEADQIESITAADVRSSDDEKVGSVGQIFLDAQTGRPEWAAVRTGFFGTKEAFVPLRNAEWDGRVVRVAYDKERVRNAPHVDPDNRGLDPDQQVELYTYYGFTETTNQPPSSSSSGSTPRGSEQQPQLDDAPTTVTGTSAPVVDSSPPPPPDAVSSAAAAPAAAAPVATPPVATPPVAAAVPPSESLSAVAMSEIASRDDSSVMASGASDDADDNDYVTRSEERLDVAVVPVATERVRLSKHVVVEQETVTVTIRREELRIERVPITADEASSLGEGDGIGASETEIILYEERPVVSTVRRPIERIRVTREVVSEEHEVTGEVRKERVEVDGGAIG